MPLVDDTVAAQVGALATRPEPSSNSGGFVDATPAFAAPRSGFGNASRRQEHERGDVGASRWRRLRHRHNDCMGVDRLCLQIAYSHKKNGA
jgi:hypothetical protein